MNSRSELSRTLFTKALGAGVASEMEANGRGPTSQLLHWQAFADYKYDDYEQYEAGRRFIESLILWLTAMPEGERLHVHDFLRDRVIYISRSEMHHFVRMAFFDIIQPRLLSETLAERKRPSWETEEAAESDAYRRRARSCLYLAMSDGAHMATFRRYAALHNDQAATSFELDAKRLDSFARKLSEDLGAKGCKFTQIVLLDDFTASGKTYLRRDETTGKWDGKIARFAQKLAEDPHSCAALTTPTTAWRDVVDMDSLVIHVVFYAATVEALAKIRREVHEMRDELLPKYPSLRFIVEAVQEIPEIVKVDRGDASLRAAIEACYDGEKCESSSTQVGGTVRVDYGFADCALPVVLFHNTPNNSLPLLWAPEGAKVAGLFPRISRHRDGV